MFDLLCLALVVYVEARGEPVDGQMLVAEVVLNRQDNEGEDVCVVAFKPDQFTGLSDPLDFGVIFADPAWQDSIDVAYRAIEGETLGSGATNYHTPEVNPSWSKEMTLLGKYGNHLFYIE